MRILLVLIAVVVVLVGVVASRPSSFRVERRTVMAAPPSTVFAQVNDFHKWAAWNPWGKLDPTMKQTYEGAPAGVGAVYTWAGNREVGEGRMTIIESRPDELIRVRLEFVKPLPGTSIAEFTFRPQGNQTAVTWSMTGTNNFMAKAIHLVMNMDRMIGGQFDRGLADMKSVVESGARPAPRS
jgi:uncharacterized protein YndB with AHSA1/START domain